MRHQEFVDMTNHNSSASAGTGILRIVLLFGSVAVALGLILVPLLAERNDTQFSQSIFENNVDRSTMTGSIHRSAIPQMTTTTNTQ